MASASVYDICIKGNTIFAEVGKTGSLDCDIICRSDNGKYFFGSGYYEASENSDSVECIFLFTKNEMLYRKKFEDTCVDHAALADDGTVIFYTEDLDIVSLHPNGKQNFKRHLGIGHEYIELSPERVRLFGSDEDGAVYFLLFDCSSKKISRTRFPDMSYMDEEGNENYMDAASGTFFLLDGRCVLLYDDRFTCFMCDLDGNKLDPSDEERRQVIALLEEKEEAERIEREHKKAEQEEFWRKRQELAETLFERFGADQKAAIKFVAKEQNIPEYKATTIVENIYSKYAPELIQEPPQEKRRGIRSLFSFKK